MKNTTGPQNKIIKFLLKGLLFIAVAAGTTLVINYFTNDETQDTVNNFLDLDPNATNEQAQEVNDEVSPSIAIPGFDRLVLQADSVTQQVTFENPEVNDVYFIISLTIDDETVYESKLVEPGKGIYSIELPREYAAGEYTGMITYETRSMADPDEQNNGAEINVPIIFE